MNKIYIYVLVLTVNILFSVQVQSEESIKFQSLYKKGNYNVVLAANRKLTEDQMSSFGEKQCNANSFCLIWYFDDLEKAKVGVEKAKSGSWFDPIPGLIAIFSKNKKINEIICYEPKGAC